MGSLDHDILGELRSDARMPYRTVGARVGLSANAAAERVRRLIATGVIRGFVTSIDEAAGADARLDLLVDVRLRPDTDAASFEAAVSRLTPARGLRHRPRSRQRRVVPLALGRIGR
jgi:Lrp/AsnC family leucine-responsive transcriptional regulator